MGGVVKVYNNESNKWWKVINFAQKEKENTGNIYTIFSLFTQWVS